MGEEKDKSFRLSKLSNNPLLLAGIIIVGLIVLTSIQPSENIVIPIAAPPICGDGVCSGGEETCLTCIEDCGDCFDETYTGLNPISIDIPPSVAQSTFNSLRISLKEGAPTKTLKAVLKRVNKPEDLPDAVGEGEKALRYVQIEFSQVDITQINQMVLSFSIDKSLISKDLAREGVKLKRYTDKWEELPVYFVKESEEKYDYEAVSPGASVFVIVSSQIVDPSIVELPVATSEPAPAEPSCGDFVCEEGENSENCCEDCGCDVGECRNGICKEPIEIDPKSIFLVGINILIIMVIIFLVVHIKSRRGEVFYQMRDLIYSSSHYLKMGDLTGGVKEYNKLKGLFNKCGNGLSKDQKREIYSESMSIHKRIVKLKKSNTGVRFFI